MLKRQQMLHSYIRFFFFNSPVVAGCHCFFCVTFFLCHFFFCATFLLRVFYSEYFYSEFVHTPGAAIRDSFAAHLVGDRDAALAMLAGCIPRASCPAGVDVTVHDEQCGKAAWLFDKVTKNFLVRCWKDRRTAIGVLKVSHGLLTRTLAPQRAPTMAQDMQPVNVRALFSPERRPEWQRWSPFAARDPNVSMARRGTPHGFYVVWRGRSCGVKYRWCDAFASVAGFSGAKCKGFNSLAVAETAFVSGAPS